MERVTTAVQQTDNGEQTEAEATEAEATEAAAKKGVEVEAEAQVLHRIARRRAAQSAARRMHLSFGGRPERECRWIRSEGCSR